MVNIIDVPLRNFYEKAANIIIPVDNDLIFLPDESWGRTFATGLQKCDLSGAVVAEVGIGCGINMAGLMLSDKAPREFNACDLEPASVAASQWLAKREGIEANILQSDLLSAMPDNILKNTDVIIACIPQVVRDPGEIKTERDFADYYEKRGVCEDDYGLGLIASMLDESAARAPHATLILNIANRPGGERIQAMFDRHGYTTEIVHKDIVRQDPTTSIESLAQIEKNTGIDFHFYSNPQTKEHIGAREAEDRRLSGLPVYHNLHVLAAKLG
jgi:methylase of polypeptide subunit release factors